MSKTFAIIGADGNMGSRYKACLEHLGYSYVGFDIGEWGDFISSIRAYSGIIIATPTHTHAEIILTISEKTNTPILCEKPITKDQDELDRVLSIKNNLAMVNQYKFLFDKSKSHVSSYNYFKTGNDGLEWDCINIIGLAESPPKLGNTSPIWKCVINGNRLHLGHMDEAYIDMIFSWCGDPWDDKEYIREAHNRVRGGNYVI